MRIHFLGTAAGEGWPGLFCQCDACLKARAAGGKNIRTRSSVLINEKYMVDFPPDTYLHTLCQKLELWKVEQLLITHSHADHFYLDDLALQEEPYAYIKNKKKLQVWGNSKVIGSLDKGGEI